MDKPIFCTCFFSKFVFAVLIYFEILINDVKIKFIHMMLLFTQSGEYTVLYTVSREMFTFKMFKRATMLAIYYVLQKQTYYMLFNVSKEN